MTKKNLNQNAKLVQKFINLVEPDFNFNDKPLNRYKIFNNNDVTIRADNAYPPKGPLRRPLGHLHLCLYLHMRMQTYVPECPHTYILNEAKPRCACVRSCCLHLCQVVRS